MAKKKIKKNLPRKGVLTVTDVRQYATQLDARRVELLAQAKAIEKSGLEAVEMDGVNKFTRGMELLDEFAASLEYYLRREKLNAQRG